jgi:hypothetical protein
MDLAGAIARGGKAAEEMAEANRPASGNFESINWFGLKDKESVVVRFLDDHTEWLSVLQHPYALTRPAPAEWTAEQQAKWPKMMSPICRKTKQFIQFFPDGCYICDHMHQHRPNTKTKTKRWYGQVRVWARAVERQEVVVETDADVEKYGVPKGTTLGYRDAEIEVDELDDDKKPTGKKITKKKILVINMALKNFFSPLQGYADVFKTVLDRDYHITRKGSDQNTDYRIVAMEPIRRADGVVVDMRDPEVVDGQKTGRMRRDAYLDDGPDLIKMIEDRIDDEMYHRFFDDRVAIPERKRDTDGNDAGQQQSSNGSSPAASTPQGASAAPAEAPAPAADQAATKARLEAMRSRVRGDNPTSPSSDDAASSPEAPAQEQQPVAAGMVDFS